MYNITLLKQHLDKKFTYIELFKIIKTFQIYVPSMLKGGGPYWPGVAQLTAAERARKADLCQRST